MPDKEWAEFAAEMKLPSRAQLRGEAPVVVSKDGSLTFKDAGVKRFADKVKQEIAERRRREAEGQ